MKSIRDVYKIGKGPSSSHTMGPERAARLFLSKYPDAETYRVVLYGSLSKTGRGHGTDKALIAGILGLAPDDARLRYSMLLAQEAGVAVRVAFSDEEPDHPNTARIRITGADGKVTEVVGASIGGGNIRITEINGMAVELSGEYPTLIVRHTDVPGVINDVTSILAREKINVAFMRVFRQARRADACMVIETDTPVLERTRQLILEWCPQTTEVFTI